MNPWGFVAMGAGILLVIIGIKGSQHTVASAITKKAATTA